MNKFNDSELIIKIKEDCCDKSFEELTGRHSKLYYKICQKYLPTLKQLGVPSDDVFNDLEFVFYKCLISFNPQKNTKFSTWLGNYARYNCLNYINSYKKYSFFDEQDFDNFSEVTDQKMEVADNSGVDYIFSILSKLKDKRIIKVYKLRYEVNGDKKSTWTDIAKKLSVSTQTAINLHSRGKNFLKKKLKSKNYQDMV